MTFCEIIEEKIVETELQELINQIGNRVTKEQLKIIDQTILYILNYARKKVEGPWRSILFSYEKERR